jgi:hypothetical protein
MTRKARSARKYENKMWMRYRQTKGYNDLLEYKRVQNMVMKEFDKWLAEHSKSNPRSFYAYVGLKTKVKDAMGPLVNLEGNKVSSQEEVCNILNDYFVSAFTEELMRIKLLEVKNIVNEDNGHVFRSVNITADDIK